MIITCCFFLFSYIIQYEYYSLSKITEGVFNGLVVQKKKKQILVRICSTDSAWFVNGMILTGSGLMLLLHEEGEECKKKTNK